jgi:anionic cell wall polymer biosynthesis LytR-Cps2A-Psr (LCP) family protein
MKYVDLKSPKKIGNKNRKRTGPGRKKIAIWSISGILMLGLTIFLWGSIKEMFNPITIVANISGVDLKETDGRTNVLVLGSDKRTIGEIRAVLTDTILVASIGKVEGDVVMISLPRDLWVSSPKGNNKINAMYAFGGPENIQSVVENVLGIPIHYYAVVDFQFFEETVDILGGVEINIEQSFADYMYPVEGMEDDACGRTEEEIEEYEKAWGQKDEEENEENEDEEEENLKKKKKDEAEDPQERLSVLQMYPCRYQTISFEAGAQKMDGETALTYARSRHGSNNQGGDFARARRQQQLIMAIKGEALSFTTLLNPTKLRELYDTYERNVDTNIDFQTAQNFVLFSQKHDFNSVRSVVLDDRSSAEVGGLLYAPTDTSLYGAYVLIPRAGDFSQVHAYVQKYLFEER